MTGGVGWYVHHHGHGHAARARAVLAHLQHPATVLTSRTDEWPVPVVRLPLDVPTDGIPPPPGGNVPLPEILHYAPVGVPGLRERVARLAAWIAEAAPALVVVDVSVEVVLLARIAGVPVVTVRQHGDRRDPAHRAAYEASAALLAPWPEELEDPTVDAAMRARTWYVGGFSRFDGRDPDERSAGGHEVVVVSGTGGAGISPGAVAAAAAATPQWRWTVLGGAPPAATAPTSGIRWRGWVDDPFPDLARADVVVATAGHNTVMEAAAARARLVVLAEDRPFDEQRHKAQVLAEAGAAIHLERWPHPTGWPRLLQRARELDPAVLAAVVDGEGAARAAARIDGLVRQLTGTGA